MLRFLAGMLIFWILLPNAAAVVISEVFYDAVDSDTGKEFVELYNPGGNEIDLSDWKIEMGNGANGEWITEARLNGSIPGFGFYLVGGSLVKGVDLEKNITLQNGPDAVRLKDGNGKVVDTLGYGNLNFSDLYEGSPTVDVKEGHSLERKPGFLFPLRGNGQDTDNNLEDFLDNPSPEPQNSGLKEWPAVAVTRGLSPYRNVYTVNSTIDVLVSYSFFEEQVGLIISESNSAGFQNSSPGYSAINKSSGIAKWLFKGTPLKNGTIEYSFRVPDKAGTYVIDGDWKVVDSFGNISEGSSGKTIISVTAGGFLIGKVEDFLGFVVENATVSFGTSKTLTDLNGSYSLPLLGKGIHEVNASKDGYVPEGGLVNVSLPEHTFNFIGNYSLVPLEISDSSILKGISRWANKLMNDDKILEAIHQWAKTSSG